MFMTFRSRARCHFAVRRGAESRPRRRPTNAHRSPGHGLEPSGTIHRAVGGIRHGELLMWFIQWEIFRILKWRYVSTICLAIFWGYVPIDLLMFVEVFCGQKLCSLPWSKM